jgi:hypothetical protein
MAREIFSTEGDLHYCVLPDGSRCRFAQDGITIKPFGKPTIICEVAQIRQKSANMQTVIDRHTAEDGSLVDIAEPGMHIVVAGVTGFMSVAVKNAQASSGLEINNVPKCVQSFTTESAQDIFDTTNRKIEEYRQSHLVHPNDI